VRRTVSVLIPCSLLGLICASLLFWPSACGGTNTDFKTVPEEADADNGPVDVVVKPPPESVRIANFNVQNLFNDKKDSDTSLPDAETVLTTSDYQTKLQGVAQIISLLQTDMIMMQEVENDSTLADLQAQGALNGAFPHRVLIKGNDPRGIDIAFLSKFPVDSAVSHAKEFFDENGQLTSTNGKTYSRDCLEVHVTIAGREIILLGVHFKAKDANDAESDAKRLSEARHTRLLVESLKKSNPLAAVLVLGDFNDTPTSEPIKALQGVGSSLVLTSASQLVPSPNAWTVNFGGLQQIYDDQFSEPVMGSFRQEGTIKILHDSELDPSLQKVADHSPVVVTYNVEKLG
jgi:endonuclease/exonuclease/phosphatase family metal-dependent hydrolase